MSTQFNRALIHWLLWLLVACIGCQQQEPVSLVPMGTLYLHLHTNIDVHEIDGYGIPYTDGYGRRMYLSLAQLYLSGIKAIRTDGSSVSLDSTIVLKTNGLEQYRIQQLPTGNYATLSFQVGLNNVINQTNPASYSATSVLGMQNPGMWFGSTSQGYVFVNVQGGVDTTRMQNASLLRYQPFSYQLGTPDELKTITMPVRNFTISRGQSQEVHIVIDYAKLLQGVNLRTEAIATPFSNPMLATKIANNVPAMFRYD